jgi:Cd2+/Zn2+-exporting ATPase
LESIEAVRLLKRIGLKRLVMLTGDRSAVASQIAQQVGIDEYQAELLPEDKLQAIYNLRHKGTVGMVGDGLNDTPALAAADVSFAVGNIDVALEAADVVLVGNDLRRLAYAIQLSRRTVSVIQQSHCHCFSSERNVHSSGSLGSNWTANGGFRRYGVFPLGDSQCHAAV